MVVEALQWGVKELVEVEVATPVKGVLMTHLKAQQRLLRMLEVLVAAAEEVNRAESVPAEAEPQVAAQAQQPSQEE
jgi:hypothetical protein